MRAMKKPASAWEEKFKQLKKWARKHPEKLPSQTAASPSDKKLAKWVNNQRNAGSRGDLHEDRMQLLEDIPSWSWNAHQEAWFTNYDALRSWLFDAPYSNTNPCPAYPSSTPPRHGNETAQQREREAVLGRWVEKQRFLHSKGFLVANRQRFLTNLPGWRWSQHKPGAHQLQDTEWNQMF